MGNLWQTKKRRRSSYENFSAPKNEDVHEWSVAPMKTIAAESIALESLDW